MSRDNNEFIQFFNIEGFEGVERAIVLTYFAFTSLSTVGFGDMYPKNSFERICCIVMILFGNSIFGYIIGDFNDMIQEAKLNVYETDEYEEL